MMNSITLKYLLVHRSVLGAVSSFFCFFIAYYVTSGKWRFTKEEL